MAKLKPYITRKYSDKRKKQQPTKNQKNTKSEISFNISLRECIFLGMQKIFA